MAVLHFWNNYSSALIFTAQLYSVYYFHLLQLGNLKQLACTLTDYVMDDLHFVRTVVWLFQPLASKQVLQQLSIGQCRIRKIS